MNSTIFKNSIAELEARINTLESKNSELKTSNQLLSKKAEWLETELAMSQHYGSLNILLNYAANFRSTLL